MVTLIRAGTSNEWAGLSTDTKPTDDMVPNASIFIEVDTGNVFFYNADGAVWVKQFSLQGE